VETVGTLPEDELLTLHRLLLKAEAGRQSEAGRESVAGPV
jgi:hypothetical protein